MHTNKRTDGSFIVQSSSSFTQFLHKHNPGGFSGLLSIYDVLQNINLRWPRLSRAKSCCPSSFQLQNLFHLHTGVPVQDMTPSKQNAHTNTRSLTHTFVPHHFWGQCTPFTFISLRAYFNQKHNHYMSDSQFFPLNPNLNLNRDG